MKSYVEEFVIEVDDPRRDDVRALLEQHLAFARAVTPPEDVHALELAGLLDDSITFFSLRVDGELLGVGALKQLDHQHAEVKSMHTAPAARRRGVGRAIVDHVLAVAAARGVRRVSLETGAGEAFAPARSLYAGAGFVPCGPFGQYEASPNSAFMTRSLP
jgi:putative acetyltransferase